MTLNNCRINEVFFSLTWSVLTLLFHLILNTNYNLQCHFFSLSITFSIELLKENFRFPYNGVHCWLSYTSGSHVLTCSAPSSFQPLLNVYHFNGAPYINIKPEADHTFGFCKILQSTSINQNLNFSTDRLPISLT